MTLSPAKLVWVIMLISVPVLAQTDAGNLTVISFPAGTAITLEGEYMLAGVTPVTFNQRLHGVYRLRAHREGYEGYQTKLVLSGNAPYQIDFEMVPKTRLKAGFRSLVLPGWGQFYTGQKVRGALYTSAAVLSLLSLLATDQDFRSRRDEYHRVLDRYSATRNIDDRRDMKPFLDDVQRRAYDAETARFVTAGIVAFVWGFNVIDAVVFFPDRRYSVGGPTSISLDTGAGFDRLGLKLVTNF